MMLANRSRTEKLVLAGLFTALTVVLSQIAIPIGAVPINLATFSVFSSGLLLGSRLGAISQLVYVLLGAVGIPVFAGFQGGLGRVVGPTGGYIFSYVVAAFLIGFIVEHSSFSLQKTALAVLVGWVTNLFMGTVWYMFIMAAPLGAALAVCVIPFIVGDTLKIVLVTAVGQRLIPILRKEKAEKS